MTQDQTLDINVYSQTTIPNSLNELMDNHGKLQQISQYCKGAYAGAETANIYDQTQSYAKNALMNVAYHIQNIGTHLTTLLQLQASEVEKIDLKVKYLNQRVEMIHESTGVNVFKAPTAAKQYKSTLKDRQIEVEDIRPPAKFVRKQVAYSIGGDGIAPNNNSNGGGASLSHSQQLSHSSSAPSSPPIGSTPPPPPPSLSSSQQHQQQQHSPPYQTPPPPGVSKRTSMAPPPPAPHSLDVPAPPRPVRPTPTQNGHAIPPPPSNFDLPPPPPSNFPPPPPPSNFDLPPPPPSNFPPPPPPMFDFPPPPPPN
ncbi:component of SCAR regulatory complex [Heterostelium album PN500]|uniref:Component of SCAR regulatory complex n=1 Tax=Heterostelium pallidum (strain ATCC 26659 / Pp 5 / PN500) TaxID=670386 RepID=D3BBS6_HETP5|nr:component of SCAR regulatory complex [Heterostelium album PN500]EFA81109.1 component of SCAR regulatory complex [Heterostelium album PN500]|eukprot:XP_020433227.1 component of SCAR regulatory complex [Heterostelium album PN500]